MITESSQQLTAYRSPPMPPSETTEEAFGGAWTASTDSDTEPNRLSRTLPYAALFLVQKMGSTSAVG